MQKAIHPDYNKIIEITCSCGARMTTGSTIKGPLKVEICSSCHPFYTGEKKLVDTAGQVEKFETRQKSAEEFQKTTATKKNKKSRENDKPTRAISLKDLLDQARS